MITKLLVSVIIPVLILLILNLRIMITICLSSRKVRENENSRKFDKIGQGNDKNAIIILICLVTMFLICHMLRFMLIIHEFIYVDVISNCLFSGSTSSKFFPQWIYILMALSEFTIILNSSSNFFVYLLAGKKFRKELFKIITQNPYARKYFSENPESNQRSSGRIHSKQHNTSFEKESGKCLKKQSTFETRV